MFFLVSDAVFYSSDAFFRNWRKGFFPSVERQKNFDLLNIGWSIVNWKETWVEKRSVIIRPKTPKLNKS